MCCDDVVCTNLSIVGLSTAGLLESAGNMAMIMSVRSTIPYVKLCRDYKGQAPVTYSNKIRKPRKIDKSDTTRTDQIYGVQLRNLDCRVLSDLKFEEQLITWKERSTKGSLQCRRLELVFFNRIGHSNYFIGGLTIKSIRAVPKYPATLSQP